MTTTLPVIEKEPSITINEVFGPTVQGEGVDVGMPCFFVRLHHCPVRCPDCDTHFSWDGSETGTRWTLDELDLWLAAKRREYPGAIIVWSGGEPLIHYRNKEFRQLIASYQHCSTLETSGFTSPVPIKHGSKQAELFGEFLTSFHRVHISPKVTPCLRGDWTYAEMTANTRLLINTLEWSETDFAFKFVCRDEEDVDATRRFIDDFALHGHKIYLMPYGIEREDIIASTERLIPIAAKYGYPITPRVHGLLWGKKRAV